MPGAGPPPAETPSHDDPGDADRSARQRQGGEGRAKAASYSRGTGEHKTYSLLGPSGKTTPKNNRLTGTATAGSWHLAKEKLILCHLLFGSVEAWR